MTTTTILPPFTGQVLLRRRLVVCALALMNTLALAAESNRGDAQSVSKTGPLSEFYLPTGAQHTQPQIAGDKKTESEDAGTRKGRAKLVADAKPMQGGSGGKGKKKKKAVDEDQTDAATDTAAEQAAPAVSEAAPAEAPPAATEQTPAPTEATPAEATATTEAEPAAQTAPPADASTAEQTMPTAETASADASGTPAPTAANQANNTAEAEQAAAPAETSKLEASATDEVAAETAPAPEKTAKGAKEQQDAEATPAADAATSKDSAPTEQVAATEDGSKQAAAAPTTGDCGAKPTTEAAASTAATEESVPAPVEAEPHWSYDGDTGPEHWAELSPKFKACGAGTRQTPIDIESSSIVSMGLEDVQFNYGQARAKVLNNGHTIQFNVDEGNSIQVDGVTYTLTQFHFHTPSEHTIDGGSYPMELHLVHKDEKGNLAVVAILMEKGAKNPLLNQLWSKLPKSENAPVALKDPVDLHALLPTDTTSYRYIGSLTTPPCTEGVKWIVMRSTMAVTMKQFAAFKKIFPMNARPLQPINARSVLEDITSQGTQASN